MFFLCIETICDETAASIVEHKNCKKKVLSNILYSQFKEQKIVGSLSFLRNFFLDSNIELGLKYINWQNGGCNPYINDCQNIETKSRNKLSIEIGVIKGLDI